MKSTEQGLLPAIAFAAALAVALAGCANGNMSAGVSPPLPSPETVTSHCLARVATPGFMPPTESALSATQWERYVSCRLGSNMVVATAQVSGDPVATVLMTLKPDGTVDTVTLSRSSGSVAWDQAVERAIGAAPPFPPAPDTLHITRVEMRFRPGHPQQGVEAIGGTNAGVGLAGESHWSVRQCTTVGAATACN
jgi:TonB family protein